MPNPGNKWRHVVISTLNSWLPGDPRGWRSKKHRKHSSGDYKNPPPPGEHAGIFRHSQKISDDPVCIPRNARKLACMTIVEELEDKGYRVLMVGVGAVHAHILVELPDDVVRVKTIVGDCKRKSSHAIRDILPGRIWAHGGRFDRVEDEEHHRNVYGYILEHIDEGAYVWSYRAEERLGPEYQKLWE